MTAEKRQWQRPELVVLVRSRPEETVLVVCKKGGYAGPADDEPLKNCKYHGSNCNGSSNS